MTPFLRLSKTIYLAAIIFCFTIVKTNAQTIEIFSNPGTSQNIVTGNLAYHAAENLYLNNELGNSTFTSSATPINRIEFNVATPGTPVIHNNFNVYLKEAPASTVTLTNGTYSTAGYTLVYTGSIDASASGWVGLNLSTAFTRTAGNNILVFVEKFDGVANTANVIWSASRGDGNNFSAATSRRYNGSTAPDASTSMMLSAFRPAIRLSHICPATSSDTTATVCNKFTWRDSTYRASGNYTFLTTNAAGCDSTITLHLTLTSLPTTFTKTDAGCFGTATGLLTVTPTAGVGPYTYRIGTRSSYVNDGTFDSLKAGNYRVSVIDATGCSGTSNLIIIGQQSPISAMPVTTPVVCNNTFTGAIKVNPADSSMNYTYSIGTSENYQSSNVFDSLRAGTYRITVKDSAGCKATFSNIIVTQPAKVFIVINSVNDPNNATRNNGSISVSGSGGAGGYMFKFGTAGMYQSSGNFNNLKAGNYRIFIKDTNNCIGSSVPITLNNSSSRNSALTVLKGHSILPENDNVTGILISPNPATSAFKLSLSKHNEVVHLRVMDINGKIVYTTQGRSHQTFTFGEAFQTGMYVVEVRQGNEVKTVKAIKIK